MFKSWFNKAEKYYGDFAFLQADMHSHVLFGIDDGAKTREESVFFIESLQKLGYSSFIATPHILSDLYPNSKETILPAFKHVQQAMPETDIRFAAEYMIDADFNVMIEDDNLLTFGDRYVLVEMSYLAESKNFREAVFNLRVKGYKPILAHPERYNYWHKNYDRFVEAKEVGCLFQLNILAAAGYYGPAVKDASMKMLADHLYDFAGTDLHHERHMQALQSLRTTKVLHQLSMYNFRNKELATAKV